MTNKKSASFAWTFSADDSLWQPQQTAPARGPTRTGETRSATLYLLIFACLAGAWIWHTQQDRTSPNIKSGRGEVTTLEAQGSHTLEPERLRWIAPTVAEPMPRTAAPAQTTRTRYFTIRHRARDAAAVAEAAPRLDHLYERLRHNFGLSKVPSTSDLTIEIVVDGLPLGNTLNITRRTILVPSPAIPSVHVEQRAATTLYHSAIYPLAGLLLTEAEAHYSSHRPASSQAWQSFIGALRLWAFWDADGSRAHGREEIIPWLYQNAQIEPVTARRAFPPGYVALCQTYLAWGLTPALLNIPLTCRYSDGDPWTTRHYPAMPTRLGGPLDAEPGLAQGALGNTVTLTTVIEYIVVTYGDESLPRLIAALDEHASWQGLIPALFDISATEFEAGWQSYLADRYGGTMP